MNDPLGRKSLGDGSQLQEASSPEEKDRAWSSQTRETARQVVEEFSTLTDEENASVIDEILHIGGNHRRDIIDQDVKTGVADIRRELGDLRESAQIARTNYSKLPSDIRSLLNLQLSSVWHDVKGPGAILEALEQLRDWTDEHRIGLVRDNKTRTLLKEASEALSDLEAAFWGLNQQASDRFWTAWQCVFPIESTAQGQPSFTRRGLMRLEAAAQLAVDQTSSRGPAPQNVREDTASHLIELFEKVSGKPATYSHGKPDIYLNGAHNPVCRFAQPLFEQFELDLPIPPEKQLAPEKVAALIRKRCAARRQFRNTSSETLS